MNRPKAGDTVEAYFGQTLESSVVVEWKGSRCFFANGWYLIWGGDAVGFLFR